MLITEKDKIRLLFRGLIPGSSKFWEWLNNKWLRYDGNPDYADLEVLQESIREALVESLPVYKLSRIQGQKYNYLREKGGKCTKVALYVDMPDDTLAIVDPFGRVTWKQS